MNLIFIENFVFLAGSFHSVGILRVDPRTKEEKKVNQPPASPEADWPVRIDLCLEVPGLPAHKMQFASKDGDAQTVEMFISLVGQLAEMQNLPVDKYAEFPDGETAYKRFLFDELDIAVPVPPESTVTEQPTAEAPEASGKEEVLKKD